MRAVVRPADHEVGADGADLRTIQHDLDVARFGVDPALRQAMRDGREAGSMAVKACLDACVHRVVIVMHRTGSLDN